MYNIFKMFKNIFKKDELIIEEYQPIMPEDLNIIQPNIILEDLIFCPPEKEGKPYILIMDDFEGMVQLVKDELQRVQCCNIREDYNIILSMGQYAAFKVERFLKEPNRTIDIAILDITLGGVIDGVEYDGVDIAIMLKTHNPNCVIKFLTGHALNKHNPEIFKFIEKFENFFKVPMTETKYITFKEKKIEMYKHIINKNGNRVAAMGDLLQEYVDLQKAPKD